MYNLFYFYVCSQTKKKPPAKKAPAAKPAAKTKKADSSSNRLKITTDKDAGKNINGTSPGYPSPLKSSFCHLDIFWFVFLHLQIFVDDNSDDDEPLIKMIKKPPSDEQLKEMLKSILKDANLEEMTMKHICQKVSLKEHNVLIGFYRCDWLLQI